MTEMISKRQVESMCRNPHRKHSPQGQPYTRIELKVIPKVEATPTGPKSYGVSVYQITGYTFEMRLVNEEWATVEEEHDLGQANTLEDANRVATEWRAGLVGVYSIN